MRTIQYSLQHIKKIAVGCVSMLLLAMPITSPAALEMDIGDWSFQVSGNVNAFSTNISCDDKGDGVVSGGLACGSDANSSSERNIQTGLLPSWLGFHAETTSSNGFYTGFTLGFQPGVDTNSALGGALDGALGLNSSNFRQVFVEFGNKNNWGTLKLGRDLGLFGSDAILSDMTLLGVGTVSDLASNGGNTTLGRIGVGYIYADWKAQIQYNSPNFNGFTFSAALVDPWGAGSLANTDSTTFSTTSGTGNQEGNTYGLEGKIKYALPSGNGHVWASYIRQSVDFDNAALAEESPEASGFDVGGKLDVGPLSLVAYYYDGEGIGTTGFLLDGFDSTGEERDSDGGYVQGMITLPSLGTKLGLSYGESNLDDNAVDNNTTLVETNKSIVAGIYQPVGHGLNLVAEYTRTEAEAHNGYEAEEDVLALGAIIFF